MNHLLTAGLTVALTVAAPSALAASRTFEVEAFTAIDISSSLDATVTVGGSQSVTAESDDQGQLDKLLIEVRDGRLHVWTDWNLFDLLSFGDRRNTTLTIIVPALQGAVASAGADVRVTGMSGDVLTLGSSAGADLDVRDVSGAKLVLSSDAGADLSVEGTCTSATASVSSGADLQADRLICEDVEINASTGADARVHATAKLTADASTGASIDVYGKPAQIEQNEGTGGSIDLRD